MIRLSLRTLFIFMAIAALAIASVRHASDGWQTTIVSVALVTFCVAAILALADRGPRRALAICCAVCMLAYGLAILFSAPLGSSIAENREFNPSTGRLPTSRLLRALYERVEEIGWVDVRTGKPADAEPSANASPNAGDSMTTTTGEIPDRESFMVIGHAWWALLLGLAGGWLARFIYSRRLQNQSR